MKEQVIKNLWTHLTDYKHNRLGVRQNGLHNGNEYGHILPEGLEKLNIIETYRAEFWNYFYSQNISTHVYFRHLNSSQATLFNLFYPFIYENKVEALIEACTLDKVSVEDTNFEAVLDTEERTNFDFSVQQSTGSHILFEAKYSENNFGNKQQPDDNAYVRWQTIYKDRVKGIVDQKWIDDSDLFFQYYQVLRNLSYINYTPANPELKNTIVFLIPKFNKPIVSECEHVKNNILLPDYQEYLKIIYWEDVIETLKQIALPEKLAVHLDLFYEKYFDWEY